jgi:hypothetical protein
MCKTNYACFLKCCSCCASNKEPSQQKVERDKVLNEAKIMVNRDNENDIENESLAAATTSSKEKRQFRAVVDKYAKENVQILLTNCNGNFLFVSFLNFGYNRMPSLV